ncbi:MAG: PKD domain-containing protein [Proteobacteria bacterium]|nr:PKD domain-containing protein [Pseudomonadota bacterium]
MRRALVPVLLGALLVGCPDQQPDPGEGPPLADAGLPMLVEVGETAQFDGGGSELASTYNWDFGDGEEGAGVAPSHAWTASGHYTVVLTVTNAEGETDSAGVRADVVWPLAPDAPSTAKRIAANADWTEVYVALPDFAAVAVIDPADRTVQWRDVCDDPRTVATASNVGRWVVACDEGNAFQVWEGDARLADVALTEYGWPARAAVLNASGDEIGVAHGGAGGLSHWTLSPVVAMQWFDREQFPDSRGLARLGSDYLVSRFRSLPGGGTWWAVNASGPDGDVLPTHTLAVDPGPDSDTTTRGVPNYVGLVPSPDGRTVALPSLQANILRGAFRDGLDLTHETTARAVLSQASIDGTEGVRKVFDNRDFASDVAFSPRGDWVYVAMLGMEAVDVLDAYTFETAGSFQGIGNGVDGVLVSPDGTELWVVASYSRELVIFDLETPGAGVEAARLDLRPAGVEELDPDILRGKQLFHRAADPRIARDGYLSCGSCHLEGAADGQTWDFTDRGEGLRNTIDLHGRGGTLQGPIHWSANFDEVQDFENDIRGGMRGTGLLTDEDFAATSDTLGPPKAGLSEDLDALAAYVESLDAFPKSPFRTNGGGLTEEAEAGRAIFNTAAAACATCHLLPEYTDSQWLAPAEPLLHDVGTLTDGSGGRLGGGLPGLDTPTLRGVWSTPPYLHDGSAATLRDVLDANVDDLHGGTSHLDEAELAALAAFLGQIE